MYSNLKAVRLLQKGFCDGNRYPRFVGGELDRLEKEPPVLATEQQNIDRDSVFMTAFPVQP
jgi:hypothetical protein